MELRADLVIVFPLYPGVTQLDFTGPMQVLSRLPGTRIILASKAGGALEADGLRLADLAVLKEQDRCDVLCVPGGPGATAAGLDEEFVGEIRRLAKGARFVASVCTGSLVLGAAGLLEGRRAACHWAWRELLALFGAQPADERVVRDGNLLTGGGVTAGIDFALALAAEIAGEEIAQAIQLSLEYAPAPPFDSGRPESASAEVLSRVEKGLAKMRDTRVAEAREAARRLGR
ncbi:MAG: DJ-1/PfpI family protein [Caulobacteraceae bacterium]